MEKKEPEPIRLSEPLHTGTNSDELQEYDEVQTRKTKMDPTIARLHEGRTSYLLKALKFTIFFIFFLGILGCICVNQLALFNLADGSVSVVPAIRTPFLLATVVTPDVIRIGLHIFSAAFSGYFGAIRPIHCFLLFLECAIEATGEIFLVGFILPAYGGEDALLLVMLAIWVPALIGFFQSILIFPSNQHQSSWVKLRKIFWNLLALILFAISWTLMHTQDQAYVIPIGNTKLSGNQSLVLVIFCTFFISVRWWANYVFGLLNEDEPLLPLLPTEGPCTLRNGLKTYVAHVTGPLRFESSVLQGVFKVLIFYVAILVYSYVADFKLLDVLDGVFRSREPGAAELRHCYIAYIVSAILAYVFVQLSGRLGALQLCCALPVILSPLVTYGIIVMRRQKSGPAWVLHMFDELVSPLTADPLVPLTGDYYSVQDPFILICTWAAGAIIGRQIWKTPTLSHNIEKFIWHRADGPGLFIYLNFLFNRNKNPPKRYLVQKQIYPPSILFIAVCFWNENLEEMKGAFRSIKNKVHHFVNFLDEGKRREALEVHIVVDSALVLMEDKFDKSKKVIQLRDFYFRVMGLLVGKDSLWKSGDKLKPCLIDHYRKNWGLNCKEYGIHYVFRFGEDKNNPRIYVHFKDAERGCFISSKRLSMGLYLSEVDNRIRDIAVKRGWAKNVRELRRVYENSFVFTADGDTLYSGQSVRKMFEYIRERPYLAGICGTVRPIGDGPLAWFQKFEYFSAHIFNKTTEFTIGTVLCLPGCFSVYRFKNLQEVIRIYRQGCGQALDLLVRQQGEDRWLTTLLTFRGHRLGYLSVAESLTHCPTSFEVLMVQRRRWITSTFANLWALLTGGDKLRDGAGLEDDEEEEAEMLAEIDKEFVEKAKAAFCQFEEAKKKVQSPASPSVPDGGGDFPMEASDEEKKRPANLGERAMSEYVEDGEWIVSDFLEEKREEDDQNQSLLKKKGRHGNRWVQWMFLLYAFINFVSAIVSPAMISILITGGLAALNLHFAYAVACGVVPPLFFVLWCLIYDNKKAGEGNPFAKTQLWVAQLISFFDVFVVAAVLVGVLSSIIADPSSPGSIFLICYAISFLMAGFLHWQMGAVICGIIYLFLIPMMYQILIIFSFFSFNDISWGTRGSGSKEAVKDPLNEYIQLILQQPILNWCLPCWVKKEKTETEPEALPLLDEKKGEEKQKKEEEDRQKLREDLEKQNQELVNRRRKALMPSAVWDDELPWMKLIAEEEWSKYCEKNQKQIQKTKEDYKVVVAPLESKELLEGLTSIKKNVLWVVFAANIVFFTVIVTMSLRSDFDIFKKTNAFSAALLFIFGFVQGIQTFCMFLDGVKSLIRRISYL